MWQILMKDVDLIWENQHHSLTFFIWVALNETVNQAKILWTITGICSNPGCQLAVKKLLYSEKIEAYTISSWSYDMEGHSKKCVERYCELPNKDICWRIVKRVRTNCSEMHLFSSNW